MNKFDTYLVGYYGMQNTGDDVLMYTSRWGAQHQLGDQNGLVSAAEDIKCSDFGDVKKMPRALFRGHHRLLHYKNASQCAKVIFGGGSVLHSEKDIHFKRHLITLAGKKDSRCVGVGIEPFTTVAAEQACQRFLNECGFVGVRDAESFDIATTLAPLANIHQTFDLAPLLLCTDSVKQLPTTRKGIMFNFCQVAINAFGDVDEKAEARRIEQAVTCITQTWLQTNEPIYLLDFNGHPKFGDFHIHKTIIAQLPKNVPVYHIPYNPEPIKVLETIASFKASVNMRLHASILSFLVKTPSMSINYHKKCRSWCKQIGLPEKYQTYGRDIHSKQIVASLVEGLGMGFAEPTLSVEEAVYASLKNWS